MNMNYLVLALIVLFGLIGIIRFVRDIRESYARSAAPKTRQQNSTPVQSVAVESLVPDPVPDFSKPLSYANFAPAKACNARSFAPDSSPSYSCDSSASYDSSSSSSSCDSGSSSSCGGGGE